MICDADLSDKVVLEYEEILGHTFHCIDCTYRKLADRRCYFKSDKVFQFNAMKTHMLNNLANAFISQSVKACKRAFLHTKQTIPHKKLELVMGDECKLKGYPPFYPANMKQQKEYVLKFDRIRRM